MKLKPYGDCGVLLAELSDAERRAWLAQLENALPAACSEYVVGHDSILLVGQGLQFPHDALPSIMCEAPERSGTGNPFRPKRSGTPLRTTSYAGRSGEPVSTDERSGTGNPFRPIDNSDTDTRKRFALPLQTKDAIDASIDNPEAGCCHDIEVKYDGADLNDVAKATGLSVAEVIQIHSAPTYTVRMMGFSPGFPYLDGLDPRLHLDRRASPRNRIAPGTVAIGGSHAGIYSVASPGGWHLLGHTDLPLFNIEAARKRFALPLQTQEAARQAKPSPRDVFALLPGDQVRFHPQEVRK